MSKPIGRLVNVGIGRETVRGDGVAAAYHLGKTSLSFDDKIISARSLGSIGRIEDSEEHLVTTQYGQGELEGEVRLDSFGLILYAMLGDLSTSVIADSAYTHSFTVANNNQHQSLGFVVADTNNTEQYKLVMLDSLNLQMELDEIVKFTAGFMSKKGLPTELTVPAITAETKFTKKHLGFKVASALGGLTAASTVSVKSLSLNISKNVELDDVLGTAEPEDILNRQISVEGEIKLNYEDETWKNYMRENTNRAMEIKLTNQDVLIGASTRPSLTIRLPKVDFFDWEPDYALDEIITQTISFKGNYDSENAVAVISTCDLVNEVASY